MDPNNNSFSSQNSSNYPFNYPKLNNFQFQNQSPNHPQHIPNYGYPPNFFMPSAVPNYRPYHGSMMSYSSQAPCYSSAPMGNETNTSVGAIEIPEFSTQMALGGMSSVHEAIPNEEDSTPARTRSSKWTTEQNLVLLSGWIKIWNRYGWSEDDVLAKAHELYSSAGNGNFKYIKQWLAIRDQPHYGSELRGNTGSGSSGSKRAHESDASDANSVGSSTRPMGRDAAKKKAKKKGKSAALEVVNKEWNEFKQLKTQELDRLNNIAMLQRETNELIKEKTQAKKMKMYLKLTEKEHLDDKGKELLQKLSHDLFGN
ncbi:hypothetical protein ARALYDRAFT_899779 [Arabidopsis lyrata subsp. lyrata]|uniref:No apical meristem-associated C-terminal domain-containing protein n=1 Tax=Arabidopsis lyrata subsp. lyrata TaxID=81972 RepID=D7L4E4_ARALL|nr:hypothetical protein ARALYDRAFT_899779 [Arabidopsis lyrata subsp. lyrata]